CPRGGPRGWPHRADGLIIGPARPGPALAPERRRRLARPARSRQAQRKLPPRPGAGFPIPASPKKSATGAAVFAPPARLPRERLQQAAPQPPGERTMDFPDPLLTRRGLLRGGLVLGASAFFVPGVFAEELARTPALTEGPFYPPRLPLD